MIDLHITGPVKKDDFSGFRYIASILPLPVLPELGGAIRAGREFRDNALFDISALVGAPRNKAGTPP